ncbi:hypothetical protein BKE38_10105 [Pseudoroseomonas deserti]|uniref:Alpha/beta hydrolase n=2 Tax=Teichococcus deserti TaxID=1817963 RepID=A0A1V2H3F0_9PROT|nr:hypothetical protein BKE38_10105 [Pseudoroseomonas deserti]
MLALYSPGASDYTLVTFGGLATRPEPGRFWAQPAVERLELDALGFVAKRENWYPTASMRRAALALAGIGRGRRLGYGHGMGAFAALKHGRRLGLQRALAVSPPASIDPGATPWDRRFRGHFSAALHPDMWLHRRDLAEWSAAICDPWGPAEAGHGPLLAAAGARLVAAPFLQGQSIFLLGQPQVLRQALELVWARDAAGLRGLLRGRRSRSARWHQTLAAVARRHRHEAWAAALEARAAALEGKNRRLVKSLAPKEA